MSSEFPHDDSGSVYNVDCKLPSTTFIKAGDQSALYERRKGEVRDIDKQGIGERTECDCQRGGIYEVDEVGSDRGNAGNGGGTYRRYGEVYGSSEGSDNRKEEGEGAEVGRAEIDVACSSFNTCKNNSNSEEERVKNKTENGEEISKLIKKYEIEFVPKESINRNWAAADKRKLLEWKFKNFVMGLEERSALRLEIEAELREEYSEDLCSIIGKGDSLQWFFRKLELSKRYDERIKAVKEENLDIAKYAESEFKTYLGIADKRYRVWKHEDKLSLGRLQTRFSPGYTKKVKVSLSPLLTDKRYKDSVFVSLTMDPKRYPSRFDMWMAIKKEENRFLTSIFKKLGKRIDYFSAVEAQDNGNPHLHILFLGVKRLMDWREVRDLWGLGHVWVNKTAEGKRIKSALAYMYKYITKAIDRRNDKNNLTQSLLWLFHIRSYSTSHGLVKPVNDVTKGEIELLGLMRINGTPLITIRTNLEPIIKQLVSEIEFDEYKPPPENKTEELKTLRKTLKELKKDGLPESGEVWAALGLHGIEGMSEEEIENA